MVDCFLQAQWLVESLLPYCRYESAMICISSSQRDLGCGLQTLAVNIMEMRGNWRGSQPMRAD